MRPKPEVCACDHHRAEHFWHWGPPSAWCCQWGCPCRQFGGTARVHIEEET